MRRAAGLWVISPDRNVLLVRRSARVSAPGTWSIPGGRLEPGETPLQAATREFGEEMGSLPPLRLLGVLPSSHFSTYITFVAAMPRYVARRWQPRLNWEHDAWGWFSYDTLPSPLHPGIWAVLYDSQSHAPSQRNT